MSLRFRDKAFFYYSLFVLSKAMKKKLLLFIGFLSLFGPSLSAERVLVRFYSELVELEYNPSLIPRQELRVNRSSISRFYRFLELGDYQPLLQNLQSQKEKLQLNDWLYYSLIRKTTDLIYKKRSHQEKILFSWFLLNKSGLDTRITFRDDQVFLIAYTEEKVFEVPLIRQDNKTFVNISEIGNQEYDEGPVYLLDFIPNPKGRSFSFSLRTMPAFQPEIEQKYIKFDFLDSTYHWPIQVDRTYIQLMKDYPFIDESEYIKAPMSKLLVNSLLPQIKQSIREMDTQLSVQFLVNFTRSAFQYKEDKEYFGKSKPMIPDEVLHYPVSDCEDRSALFFSLVENTLALPMILIAFPDHLSVGVYLPQVGGETFYYQGKKYLFCDPTGPDNSLEIGRIPADLRGVPYEIILSYPEN